MQQHGQAAIKSVLLVAVMLVGLFAILEPNIQSSSSGSNLYTLTRLLGWIFSMGALAALIPSISTGLSYKDKTLFLDVVIYTLCVLAITFGTLGALTGSCFGIIKTVQISDTSLRIMEAVYAVAGLILAIAYTIKRHAVFESFWKK